MNARQVWFVTGSQHLYGPDVLEQVTEQSRRVAQQIDAASGLGAHVVWQPVLTDADQVRRTLSQANDAAECIGVIAWMHTFSPAKMWLGGLAALDVPLLHLHTQVDAQLPWASIDMGFMNLNQSAHGDREFAHALVRAGTRRKTVVGHVGDPAVITRIGSWVAAARGRAALRATRLARFGDNMRNVAVTEGDKVEAELRFGASVNTYAVNDLVAVVDSTAESDIDALIDEYRDQYDVAAELAPGGDRHDALRGAARIEAGLRRFLTDGGFTAFTTNFEDLGGLRQLPGLGVQRLMADGYGFGAEGDWKTALLLAATKAMRPGGTSFMEDYTYHLGPGTPKILGAHMLEICPTIAAQRPRMEIHPLSIGDRADPVRLVFDAAAGPGIVLGIVDLGDRFRLVINEIDVTPPDEPLPNLPVARAVWAPRPSLSTSAECWLTAGGPHHTVLSQAVDAAVIEDFASMTGTEALVIDAGTTPRAFADALRWNAAYHRIGAGLPGAH